MPKFNVGLVRRTEFIVEADSKEEIGNSLVKYGLPNWIDFDDPETDFIYETNMEVSPYELCVINKDGEIDIK